MAAKAKFTKGCQILTEITTPNTYKLGVIEQLRQKDWTSVKYVAIIGYAIVLAYPRGIRKGCNFALGL